MSKKVGRKTNPPSPLSHPDILTNILSFADKSTLARCLCVSWSFHEIAAPVLYEDITVVPNEADAIFRGASMGPMIFSDGSDRELKKELLRHVKRLRIKRHGQCDGFSGRTACTRWRGVGIEFPALEVLSDYSSTSGHDFSLDHWGGCPWIPNLKHSKLVMRDVNVLSACRGCSFIPYTLPPEITKAVVTLRTLRNLRESNESYIESTKPTYPSTLSPTLKVVIVLWCDTPDQVWDSTHAPMPLSSFDNLVEQLALCAFIGLQDIVICNASRIRIMNIDASRSQQYLGDAVKEMVEGICKSRREVKKSEQRMATLRWMDFEQYLVDEESRGEYSDEEIRPWLN
ncbi:hypothetical protein I317_02149 [Kwoniella heveanensis CBS 569]|nr:hypothetical protein I317_02149 [Kwoniella heveanensis CBS 569]